MAQVHPSRLGLVPGGNAPRPPPPPPPSREDELRRKLLERRQGKEEGDRRESDSRRSRERSQRPGRSRESDGRKERQRSRSNERYRDTGRRDRRDGQNASPPPQPNSPRPRDDRHDLPPHLSSQARDSAPRERRPSPPPRDRRPSPSDRDRRPSPSYGRYEPPPPRREEAFIPLNGASGNGYGSGGPARYGYGSERNDLPGPGTGGPPPPWRGIGAGGAGWQGPPRGGPGFAGPMDLDRRRVERENSKITVWPPSPKQPYRDEDERDADRKAARKAKKSKSSKKSKKRHYSSSDSDTDSEDERRRRRRRKEKERRKRRDSTPLSDAKSVEKRKSKDQGDTAADQWVEKAGKVIIAPPKEVLEVAIQPPQLAEEYSSDEEVGPHLPTEHFGRDKRDRSAYTNMLKGEGEAMAQFLDSGERIPRRGEIGLESEQIELFETSGYVMSGSRHRRMNAVRMRKENQVINAEEKRAILNLQREEKMKKEGMIISQFKEMMEDNLKKQGIPKD